MERLLNPNLLIVFRYFKSSNIPLPVVHVIRKALNLAMNGWQLLFALFGVLTSIYSCFFVVKKLELNKVIKGLLIGMTISQLVSFVNICIGLILIDWLDFRNKLSCYHSILWGSLLFSGSLIFNSAISLSRFYITWKTHLKKYPQSYPIIFGTTLVYTLNFTLSSSVMGIQAYYELPGAISVCSRLKTEWAKNDTFKVRALPILVWILPILLIAFAGILGDLSLKTYLEFKQKAGHEATLVPWNSQAEQYKATIPIRATLLTVSTSLIWTLGLMPTFFALGFQDVMFVGLLAYEVVQVPMIIAWTAKLNNRVQPQLNLNQLHFHGEDLENGHTVNA